MCMKNLHTFKYWLVCVDSHGFRVALRYCMSPIQLLANFGAWLPHFTSPIKKNTSLTKVHCNCNNLNTAT